jgi:uncharacterized protein (DUF433 family)
MGVRAAQPVPSFVEALVDRTAGVAGGSAHIARTRIPVWVLEGYRRLGWADDQILESFPALRPIDLLAAFAYAEEHRAEIDREITDNESA